MRIRHVRMATTLCALALFFLTGCTQTTDGISGTEPHSTESGTPPQSSAVARDTQSTSQEADGMEMEFTAAGVTVGGYDEDGVLPLAEVTSSVEELQAFYEKYRAVFALDQPAYPGFVGRMAAYDDTFFEGHSLVLVLLQASGSAESITLQSVRRENNTLVLTYQRELSELAGTTALIYTAEFVELDGACGDCTATVEIV